MQIGDMVIRYPDTTMYVWVQGRFMPLFSATSDAIHEDDRFWTLYKVFRECNTGQNKIIQYIHKGLPCSIVVLIAEFYKQISEFSSR